MATTALFFVVAFLAAIINSIAGFGAATFTTPVLALVINIKQTIILIAFFHGFSSLSKVIQLRRSVDITTVFWYGIPAVLTAIIGAYFLNIVAPGAISLGLGAFLMLFAITSLLNVSWRLPHNRPVLVTGGVITGFVTGLIGLGGAIRGAFLFSMQQKKEVYIATSSTIALCVDIARTATYMVQGNLESRYYWFIPVLLVIGFAGTWLGVKFLRWLPESIVKMVVLIMLLLVSIFFILNYFGVVQTGGSG
jgi:uncharacterized membrane protein YfcA